MRKLFTILLLFPLILQAQISIVGSYVPPSVDTTANYKLLLYYNMNETSGTTLADSKGLTPATLHGSLTNATGILGKGVSQSDSTNYIATNSYTYLNLNGRSAFSVSMWFYVDSLSSVVGTQQLLLQFGSSYIVTLSLHVEYTDDMWVEISNNSFTTFAAHTTPGSVTAEAWHHIVVTCAAGQNINLYLDGVLDNASTQVFTGTVLNPITNLFIGNNGNPDNAVIGILDELGIWDMALPIERVWWLFKSGTGRSYPFLP